MFAEAEYSHAKVYSSPQPKRLEGMAVSLAPQHLLTCAHVVRSAFDVGEDWIPKETDELRVEFPWLAPTSEYFARVCFWGPTHSRTAETDLAILEVVRLAGSTVPLEDIPFAALGVHVNAIIDSPSGSAYTCVGFPYEEPTRVGRWAHGTIENASGPKHRVQLNSPSVHRSGIKTGYSGTAVFDKLGKTIAGIVVQTDEKAALAWMISSSVILASCRDFFSAQSTTHRPLTSSNAEHELRPDVTTEPTPAAKKASGLMAVLSAVGMAALFCAVVLLWQELENGKIRNEELNRKLDELTEWRGRAIDWMNSTRDSIAASNDTIGDLSAHAELSEMHSEYLSARVDASSVFFRSYTEVQLAFIRLSISGMSGADEREKAEANLKEKEQQFDAAVKTARQTVDSAEARLKLAIGTHFYVLPDDLQAWLERPTVKDALKVTEREVSEQYKEAVRLVQEGRATDSVDVHSLIKWLDSHEVREAIDMPDTEDDDYGAAQALLRRRESVGN